LRRGQLAARAGSIPAVGNRGVARHDAGELVRVLA